MIFFKNFVIFENFLWQHCYVHMKLCFVRNEEKKKKKLVSVETAYNGELNV